MTLTERVRSTSWYHTIELPEGIVTPGEYDLRSSVRHVQLPASLKGARCLDIGTRDGFWAFEMERRGAAEVVGIDLHDANQFDYPLPKPTVPPAVHAYFRENAAFHIAREALGSKVERREQSVYSLSPERNGMFDFVLIGTLLHHLRDPIGALMAIRSVVAGALIVVAEISPTLSLLYPRVPHAELATLNGPYWWLPNIAAQRRMIRAAGFQHIERSSMFLERYGSGIKRPRLSLGLRALILRFGLAHVAFKAT